MKKYVGKTGGKAYAPSITFDNILSKICLSEIDSVCVRS